MKESGVAGVQELQNETAALRSSSSSLISLATLCDAKFGARPLFFFGFSSSSHRPDTQIEELHAGLSYPQLTVSELEEIEKCLK